IIRIIVRAILTYRDGFMRHGNDTVSFRSVRGIGSTNLSKIDGFYTAFVQFIFKYERAFLTLLSSELGKDDWLYLIQQLITAIDSKKYVLSSEEVKRELNVNPVGFFDFLRRKIGLGDAWLSSLTPQKKERIVRMLSSGDNYGEAVHKLGLTDGLTPIVACVALFWAEYRG
ncbi:MAG TPA: hypothetical protein VNK44_05770, partial [Candidatus Nitrosotenuis sp.]|nr:hypothetical protein [Candidatus Nitrosotenuis sp.]